MEIQRTANAGVLLKMDGVSILLDGLCDRVEGYLPTPRQLADRILQDPPDLLAFTHRHADHCSKALVSEYTKQNLRPVIGPESLHSEPERVGNVTVTAVPSRHIEKVEPELQHVSFVIQGSKCVWFVGDAAPSQWKHREDLPRPDVLIAPYAYANTKAGWEVTTSLTNNLVLLHLPDREKDCYGLWDAVEQTTKNRENMTLWIPQMGEQISL